MRMEQLYGVLSCLRLVPFAWGVLRRADQHLRLMQDRSVSVSVVQ